MLFRRKVLLKIKKNSTFEKVEFGARDGTGRLLRLRLAYYPLGDPNPADFGTRLPLLAKNSPPDCFLNAQTLSGSSPVKIITKKQSPHSCVNSVLVRETGLEGSILQKVKKILMILHLGKY